MPYAVNIDALLTPQDVSEALDWTWSIAAVEDAMDADRNLDTWLWESHLVKECVDCGYEYYD